MRKENLILILIILGMIIILVLNVIILQLINRIESDDTQPILEKTTEITIEDCKAIAEESERKRIKCNELGLQVSGLGEFRCYPTNAGKSECNIGLSRINEEAKIIGGCETNFPTRETALANCLRYVDDF